MARLKKSLYQTPAPETSQIVATELDVDHDDLVAILDDWECGNKFRSEHLHRSTKVVDDKVFYQYLISRTARFHLFFDQFSNTKLRESMTAAQEKFNSKAGGGGS